MICLISYRSYHPWEAWWSNRVLGRQVEYVIFDPGEGQPSSGLDQAREGRLVDALAVRGDEGRDTLR